MNGTEFGRALLAAIEADGLANEKQLASRIRQVLGIAEPQLPAPVGPSQPVVRQEFPQLRVKFDSSGKELARKVCNSLDELGKMMREDPELACWSVLPIDTPVPQGGTEHGK
ncbi:MAG TPA: hypothetical protein VOA78_15345 [Candidatus Dormibacteraeota bacterium]|nr:hypothetical protein [Candidatus Dormibacteraeota bacterium]